MERPRKKARERGGTRGKGRVDGARTEKKSRADKSLAMYSMMPAPLEIAPSISLICSENDFLTPSGRPVGSHREQFQRPETCEIGGFGRFRGMAVAPWSPLVTFALPAVNGDAEEQPAHKGHRA